MAFVQTKGDVIYLCGYNLEDSKAKFVKKGVIQHVAGRMFHGKVIGNGYVSSAITESLEGDYLLLEPLNGDDPPVTTIGKTKGHYILWSSKCIKSCAAT